MAKLEACPRCKGGRVSYQQLTTKVAFMCGECRYWGPEQDSPALALVAWNALDRTDYVALAKELATWVVRQVKQGYGQGHEWTPETIDLIAKAKAAGLVVEGE